MKMFFKFLSALIFSLMAVTFCAAAEREEKVVYHITDSNIASLALRNVRNHLDQSPKAKIVVVAIGAGVDFLLDGAQDKNGNPYEIAVQDLAAKKVEFRVCNNTLISRNIDKSKLLPETSLVPSGVAEVSRLQIYEGYAYIKP